MKTYMLSGKVEIWTTADNKLSARQLKAKVKAFEELFGECEVFVTGNFYSWINGVESPGYSLHPRGEKAMGIGNKYISFQNENSNFKVLPDDGDTERSGAYHVTIQRIKQEE